MNHRPLSLPCAAALLCLGANAWSAEPASGGSGLRATQWELRLTPERLDNNQPDWRATELALEHRFAPRLVAYGTLADTERYGLRDQHLQVGLYAPLTTQWTLNAEATTSPTHRAREIGSTLAQLQYSLGNGLDLSGGFKRSDYDLGNLQATLARADYYFGNESVAYSLNAASTGGSSATAHLIQYTHFYGDNSSFTLRYGWGDEIDLVAAGAQRLGTRSWGLNGRHWLAPEWAITWMAGQTMQDGAATRTGLSLGIRRAF